MKSFLTTAILLASFSVSASEYTCAVQFIETADLSENLGGQEGRAYMRIAEGSQMTQTYFVRPTQDVKGYNFIQEGRSQFAVTLTMDSTGGSESLKALFYTPESRRCGRGGCAPVKLGAPIKEVAILGAGTKLVKLNEGSDDVKSAVVTCAISRVSRKTTYEAVESN